MTKNRLWSKNRSQARVKAQPRIGFAVAVLALAVVLAGCAADPEEGRTDHAGLPTAGLPTAGLPTAGLPTAGLAPTQQAPSKEEQMNLDQELIRAAKDNNPDLVRELISAGGNVNAKDSIQDSAFLYAGAEGFNEVLALTLENGADVRSTNRYGGTALIPASEHGHLETIRMLLAAGVPVNHVNNLGWTALQEAILLNNGGENQQQALKLLLAAGADPGIRDPEGRTALDNAERLGFTAIAAQIRASGFGAS